MFPLAIATTLSLLLPTPPIAAALPQAIPVERPFSPAHPFRGQHADLIDKAATVPASFRSWAKCVVHRESGGTLTDRTSGLRALNSSYHQGRFQFSRDGNHGGPYRVRDQLVDAGLSRQDAREVRIYLSGRPIWKWPAGDQDALFIEAVQQGGSHHWSLRGSSCEALRHTAP